MFVNDKTSLRSQIKPRFRITYTGRLRRVYRRFRQAMMMILTNATNNSRTERFNDSSQAQLESHDKKPSCHSLYINSTNKHLPLIRVTKKVNELPRCWIHLPLQLLRSASGGLQPCSRYMYLQILRWGVTHTTNASSGQQSRCWSMKMSGACSFKHEDERRLLIQA